MQMKVWDNKKGLAVLEYCIIRTAWPELWLVDCTNLQRLLGRGNWRTHCQRVRRRQNYPFTQYCSYAEYIVLDPQLFVNYKMKEWKSEEFLSDDSLLWGNGMKSYF